MISLSTPGETQIYYFPYSDFLFGPVNMGVQLDPIVTQLSLSMDSMHEQRNIYGENNVSHQKAEGDLAINLLSSDVVSFATDAYPDRVTAYLKNKVGAVEAVSAAMGIVDKADVNLRRYTYYQYGAPYCYYFGIPENIEGCLFAYWYFFVRASAPTLAIGTVLARIYSVENLTDQDYCKIRHTSQGYSDWTSGHGFNFTDPNLSGPDIIAAMHHYSTARGESSLISQNVRKYRPRTTYTYSPTAIRSTLDAYAIELEDSYKLFPLPDSDYGCIAMEAANKVNKNQVNMFAFLRDMRHPTEMIPKLKNMLKLKDWSDRYLTVNYGILPTVSDIQAIVRAFRNVLPYIDKNGFETYSSMDSSSISTDNLLYELEQHIKLAIDDEDSELLHLARRIDSSGFLPSFQDIWDLVPYSFVIDWFVDVGGLLERIDTGLRISRLNIRYTTSSRKASVTRVLPRTLTAQLYGSISVVHYRRWVSDQCPVPPLSLLPTFQGFNHWLESGALLIQRAKF